MAILATEAKIFKTVRKNTTKPYEWHQKEQERGDIIY